jgi:hypothetical protein
MNSLGSGSLPDRGSVLTRCAKPRIGGGVEPTYSVPKFGAPQNELVSPPTYLSKGLASAPPRAPPAFYKDRGPANARGGPRTRDMDDAQAAAPEVKCSCPHRAGRALQGRSAQAPNSKHETGVVNIPLDHPVPRPLSARLLMGPGRPAPAWRPRPKRRPRRCPSMRPPLHPKRRRRKLDEPGTHHDVTVSRSKVAPCRAEPRNLPTIPIRGARCRRKVRPIYLSGLRHG